MEPSRPQHQCEPGSVRQPAWPYLTLLIERQLLPKEEILGYSELWERTPVVTNRSRSPNSSETAESRVRIEVRNRSMPNGLYWQTCRGRTGNWPIERIHCEKTDSNGKPDFSVVYATRIEFLRTTGSFSTAVRSMVFPGQAVVRLGKCWAP